MNKLQQHDYARLQAIEWLLGVDEAGRGCLAGPVVAGACIVNSGFFNSKKAVSLSQQINDSKQLSAEQRNAQFEILEELKSEGLLDFAVAFGSVSEIAEHNILGSTRRSMQRALEVLAQRSQAWQLPELYQADPLFSEGSKVESHRVQVLVDGRPLKPFPYLHSGIVKGDGLSLVIAMASIAAKVLRDREMQRLAQQYPDYGFEVHKGYGTAMHRAAILKHGATAIHRELFLRKILS